MPLRSRLSRAAAALVFASLAACGGGSGGGGASSPPLDDLARYVDPMIGTLGSGNVIPGPSLPHGFVKLSPDTNAGTGDIDAYEYANDKIEAFSHTHLEGPGGSFNGYSQLGVMAVVGNPGFTESAYAQRFSHASEVAEPGYYAVTLDDSGVRAELTATARVGVHRYTFPATDRARLLIDVSHNRGFAVGGWVEVVDARTVRGFGLYQANPLVAVFTGSAPGDTGLSPLYFHAVVDTPSRAAGTWSGTRGQPGVLRAEGADIGAFLDFTTGESQAVVLRVGVSAIDVEQARANLEQGAGELPFDAIRASARAAWNTVLNRVAVDGGGDDQRVQLYTALYHTLLQPVDFTEGGRYWSGADGVGAVYEARRGGAFYSDDWCLWDTFRTTHPLQTLVEPERRDDVVQSYVDAYQQSGWLPKCSWRATGDSRVMIGNHQGCMALDAWRKGFRGFDAETFYDAAKKSADLDENPVPALGCGYFERGTPPSYVKNGFVGLECDVTQAAAMTLEYAYDDWCLSELAGELGHGDDAERYAARAQNYRNQWNAANQSMQARFGWGAWLEPFDPTATWGFTEANAWIYTWFVPHDVPGLMELMGGAAPFAAKLDTFFDGGHYDASNEPDFHAPYLYAWAGQPASTARRVRALLDSSFSSRPDGLPGNDDAGATSAWLAFSMLGLYPVTPGAPVYVLGTPSFERAELRLGDASGRHARSFVIEAPGASPASPYVQRATLNGAALERAWLTHDELAAGGTLVLEMGSTPSTWATNGSPPPPSGGALERDERVFVAPG
ncbi:MAG: GH92 family glycosyl hydrolase [Deltaproteobacteria bacterium]|nr:GH92 family glycosyl hydrolase [Deltaproteobacteria bacterium]